MNPDCQVLNSLSFWKWWKLKWRHGNRLPLFLRVLHTTCIQCSHHSCTFGPTRQKSPPKWLCIKEASSFSCSLVATNSSAPPPVVLRSLSPHPGTTTFVQLSWPKSVFELNLLSVTSTLEVASDGLQSCTVRGWSLDEVANPNFCKMVIPSKC